MTTSRRGPRSLPSWLTRTMSPSGSAGCSMPSSGAEQPSTCSVSRTGRRPPCTGSTGICWLSGSPSSRPPPTFLACHTPGCATIATERWGRLIRRSSPAPCSTWRGGRSRRACWCSTPPASPDIRIMWRRRPRRCGLRGTGHSGAGRDGAHIRRSAAQPRARLQLCRTSPGGDRPAGHGGPLPAAVGQPGPRQPGPAGERPVAAVGTAGGHRVAAMAARGRRATSKVIPGSG